MSATHTCSKAPLAHPPVLCLREHDSDGLDWLMVWALHTLTAWYTICLHQAAYRMNFVKHQMYICDDTPVVGSCTHARLQDRQKANQELGVETSKA